MTTSALPDVTETPNAVEDNIPGAELNIADLTALKSIIEVASERSAFRVNELEAVGNAYNRLSRFLESFTDTKEKE